MRLSIFKVVPNEDDTIDSLQQRLIYIMRADATRNNYIYGAGTSTYNPYSEMMMVKEVYQQLNGKAYFHYIFSIEETDEISLEDLYDFGIQIAQTIARFHGRFQVIMALHFNVPEHYHLHLIANNIDFNTGKRLRMEKCKLFELKSSISIYSKKYGISEIRKISFSENNGK